MTSKSKIDELKGIISERLKRLIDRDFWLFDVPHYTNIGDALIWQGELDFLSSLPYKCKGMRSYYTPVPTNIGEDDLILLHGGGNFGDIYYEPHAYKMQVMQKYPHNKIILLPQTVWFEHEENVRKCAEIMSKCTDLTLCARDKVSYDFMKQHFGGTVLLLPDMAFCIDTSKWHPQPASKGNLLLKRIDVELKETKVLKGLEESSDMTVCDWPTFAENSWQKNWLRRTRKYVPALYDWYAQYVFLPYLVNSGVTLISSHDKIYSTRLHAAIMSILLGKEKDLTWFDNSYGKNFNFYDAWLKDVDGITFVK